MNFQVRKRNKSDWSSSFPHINTRKTRERHGMMIKCQRPFGNILGYTAGFVIHEDAASFQSGGECLSPRLRQYIRVFNISSFSNFAPPVFGIDAPRLGESNDGKNVRNGWVDLFLGGPHLCVAVIAIVVTATTGVQRLLGENINKRSSGGREVNLMWKPLLVQ